MSWYMRGQSDYETADFHMGFFFDMNGFASGDYDSIVMPGNCTQKDPFMVFAAETKPTWDPGNDVVEIGLWDDYRIKINDSGVWGWHEGSGDWFSLFSAEAPTFDLVDDITPQLGGYLDINSKGMTRELTAGATLAVGDLCYLKLEDQEMYKAKADDDATCNTLLAISLDTPDDGEVGTFLTYGDYTHGSAIFSAGEIHYVSDTDAGEIVDEALIPDTTGDIVRIVGYGISTTVLFFNPDKTYLEMK